ncbi:MAG TPA: hypothetical protein VKB95_14820 [Chitinophagaceae bacterium]|nr:hypothetical protein [Chitinophagaceae bacterium]
MYKQILFFILFSILSFDINAQKGNTMLSVNGETTIPVFQNDLGFGFFLKGSYGIGKSGQLTLSGGVSKFNSKNSIETGKITTRLVPLLFGYKQNIRKFFIEPKIGLGELGGKILLNGDYSRPSVAALFGGLGAGYTIKRFNLGINFLTVHGIENNSAGIWYNKNFHYTSIYIGYELFSKLRH